MVLCLRINGIYIELNIMDLRYVRAWSLEPCVLRRRTENVKKISTTKIVGYIITVSYTHLDVYKRQRIGCPPSTIRNDHPVSYSLTGYLLSSSSSF